MSPGNVLIIGGNGFLGQHTVAALAPRADSLHVFDREGSQPDAAGAHSQPWPTPVQHVGSVIDPEALSRAAEASDADTIIALASYSHQGLGLIKAAEQNPAGAVDVNILGLRHVLEVAAQRPGTRVLWLSSTTVYGQASRYEPPVVTEDSMLDPQSVYAATKVLGERLIRTYRDSHGVAATAIRPTLVWGPGLRYRGVQSFLGDLVTAAAHGQEVTVAGCDEPWDLLYVRDAGRAVAWLAEQDLGPLVLVNGYQASVHQICDAVLAAVPGARIRVEGRANRLDLPMVDDSLLRSAGFAPHFDLEGSVDDFLRTASTCPPPDAPAVDPTGAVAAAKTEAPMPEGDSS